MSFEIMPCKNLLLSLPDTRRKRREVNGAIFITLALRDDEKVRLLLTEGTPHVLQEGMELLLQLICLGIARLAVCIALLTLVRQSTLTCNSEIQQKGENGGLWRR